MLRPEPIFLRDSNFVVNFFSLVYSDHHLADGDAEADEDEGHFTNGNEKDDGKDKDRIDDESFSEEGSPEHQNGDISVSLLRAKNLSLLQSQ